MSEGVSELSDIKKCARRLAGGNGESHDLEAIERLADIVGAKLEAAEGRDWDRTHDDKRINDVLTSLRAHGRYALPMVRTVQRLVERVEAAKRERDREMRQAAFLGARLAAALEALRPFAEAADVIVGDCADHPEEPDCLDPEKPVTGPTGNTVGDYLQARDALTEADE